jgi:hypothetical protein
MDNLTEIKVFISSRSSVCDECGEHLGEKAWIVLQENKGALCLACADLDHLVYLPPGDAALSRRSKKYSTLSAVVLQWSRSRKRYERQGILIEHEALEQAEEECLADADVRERRRARNDAYRTEQESHYREKFAVRVRELYPSCPDGIEHVIATHACQKYSRRVGRSVQAKNFDEEAIRLAVVAHIRHRETNYDKMLSMGYDRHEARSMIQREVDDVINRWEAIVIK